MGSRTNSNVNHALLHVPFSYRVYITPPVQLPPILLTTQSDISYFLTALPSSPYITHHSVGHLLSYFLTVLPSSAHTTSLDLESGEIGEPYTCKTSPPFVLPGARTHVLAHSVPVDGLMIPVDGLMRMESWVP